MPIRLRKLIGTVMLLLLIAAWSFLAMAAAQLVLPGAHALTALAYYAVVGLGWVLPAMPLVRWMQRPDPELG
jgi:hypothetical protein